MCSSPLPAGPKTNNQDDEDGDDARYDHTLHFDQSSREGTKTHDANAMLLNYDIYFVLFIVCVIFSSER